MRRQFSKLNGTFYCITVMPYDPDDRRRESICAERDVVEVYSGGKWVVSCVDASYVRIFGEFIECPTEKQLKGK